MSKGSIFRFGVDALLFLICLCLSFLLRFGGSIPDRLFPFLPLFAFIELLLLALWEILFALPRTLWRFTDFRDFRRLTQAITLEKSSFALLTFALYPFLPYPRSVILLSWSFTLVALVGARGLRRWAWEKRYESKTGGGRRLLIVGAGEAGRRLAQEISAVPSLQYDLVGFVDDDPYKQNARVAGYPVLGRIRDVPELVKEYEIEEVIIAIPSAPREDLKRIFLEISSLPVRVRMLPSLEEITAGKPLLQSVRGADLADFLKREEVKVDYEGINKLLLGKRVLVTGAGGSIGGELCRQIVGFAPAHLILLGHGENSLFYIEQELREQGVDFPLSVVVADIRDREKMEHIFERIRPQIVFHTAAHKHVPLMEINPDEAITNNVLATKILAEISHKTGVEKFIYISTDKAVAPVSVMGASKRIGEMLMRYYNQNSTTAFLCVRFGNVLGSRGSVLEVFERQLSRGKPLTITHPDMERFFMTIPEAVRLILKASELGEGGEIFVLDMGKPIKIKELAQLFVRVKGLTEGKDVEIRITGKRPGEKMREELVEEGEETLPTTHPRILKILPKDELGEDFLEKIEELVDVALTRDAKAIKSLLKEMIPTYKPEEA